MNCTSNVSGAVPCHFVELYFLGLYLSRSFQVTTHVFCSIGSLTFFSLIFLRAPDILGVALVLCQSDPVLNDGQSGSDQSRKAVIEGVRKRFIEKVVTEHEDDDDGSSSD